MDEPSFNVTETILSPFQCLAAFKSSPRLLFAASGPQILAYDLESRVRRSLWPGQVEKTEDVAQENADEGSPSKKRKRSSVLGEQPNVIKLMAAGDNIHLVAVTAEDKCLRVFKITENGQIEQLSERCMPKRPCAVAITSDSKSILCGDKFGDVYAVPLEYKEAFVQPEPAPVEKKAFKPAASEKTVHSVRNRKTLEAQMRQASIQRSKDPLKFEYELLLGHVSLLTDLIISTLTDYVSRKTRRYILTSDRDEHIRVSRGQPQAHIVEGFCLGHENFVNKLCLLTSDVLISGGGDDYLICWDWKAGKELARIDLQALLGQAENVHSHEIAVSGMWVMSDTKGHRATLAVACENVAALLGFVLDITDEQSPKVLKQDVCSLTGWPLDAVAVNGSFIISTAPHLAESNFLPRTFAVRPEMTSDEDATIWVTDESLVEALSSLNEHATVEMTRATFEGVFCGIENLRKRRGTAPATEEEEEEAM